jgi:SulP family sulfate permease
VASTLAVLSGVLLIAAGVLRLGFVADFISRPVLSGFKVGMGITIAIGQLGNILRLPVTGDNALGKARSAIEQLGDASVATVLVAATTVGGLLVLRRLAPRVPGPLVALAGGILAVSVFGLTRVATVADVPTGLPRPGLPDLGLTKALLPSAAGVALMIFTESIAAARGFRRQDDPPVDADRELVALGAAGLAGGFFRAYPAGGGLSQTAVNDASDARSQLAGLVTSGASALTLLALAPLFSDLPLAVLAGIVLVAALGLADAAGLRALRSMRADEYWLAIVTCAGVLLLGTLAGILTAVLVSITLLLWLMNHPPIVRLGRDPVSGSYRNLALHPELTTTPGMLIIRVESRLYFANARRVTTRMLELVDEERPAPAVLLIDAEGIGDTDVTAAEAIEELADALGRRGVEFWGANIYGRMRELAEHRERWEHARTRVFPTLDAAVEAFGSRGPAT